MGVRRLLAIGLACSCAGATQQGTPSLGIPDGGIPSIGIPDGGAPDASGVQSSTPDAGSTASDAGVLDAGGKGGLTYSPIVGTDGGELSLVVAAEPGSSCAALMPEPVEPVVTNIDISPDRLFWFGATTDGRGDLLLDVGTDCCQHYATPAADGGIQAIGSSGEIIPQADNFLIDSIEQGPCLICRATLLTYPASASIALGTGLSSSKNCSFAPRFDGDGAYVSCTGPFVPQPQPPTFSRYDASLGLLSSKPGDGNLVFAADAQNKLLEVSQANQWRWIDDSLTPLSDWFPAGPLFPRRLIGGGFLDRDGRRLIPSGSAAVAAPPDWLAARPGVSIVLGGRAYALSANDCALEIRDAAGALCGSVTIVNCRQPPLPGYDGSITAGTDEFGISSQTRYLTWPRLLR